MNTPNPMLITTKGLSKKYGQIEAIRDLSIGIPQGAVGLLGPNGAGKSTLIKVLLGLTPKSGGDAKVFDLSIDSEGLEIRQNIGYMPENPCLDPNMNAVSLVSYFGQLSGLPRNHAMQRAHEVLYYVRLGDERYRPIKTYSVGMKQKVKLAQALIHDPKLIFLDEPTTGLDPYARNEMLDLIKTLSHRDKKSILFSTHILPDVEYVCDDVVILDQGALLVQGGLKDLLTKDTAEVIVKIKGNQEVFVTELSKLGYIIKIRKNDMVVSVKGETTVNDIIKVAAEKAIQIRFLSRGVKTLEELFIERVKEGV
jgi:ABC-2 type transport system ATP-binding protein